MRTIPLLPCASIDEIAKYADHLGFRVTYRQVRPNPYMAWTETAWSCTTSASRASCRRTPTAAAW